MMNVRVTMVSARVAMWRARDEMASAKVLWQMLELQWEKDSPIQKG